MQGRESGRKAAEGKGKWVNMNESICEIGHLWWQIWANLDLLRALQVMYEMDEIMV